MEAARDTRSRDSRSRDPLSRVSLSPESRSPDSRLPESRSPESRSPDRELRDAAHEVRLGVMALVRRLRGQRQEHGVSALSLAVLSRLYRHRALTPRVIAEAEHVTPQTLTRVFAGLEERGLVVRSDDPRDGRQSLLEITPAGVEVLREDSARREEWLAGAMDRALTPAEQQIIRIAAGLMERLADE